ncbi:MAG: HAD hydrolase-like protein [Candidatus Paceibacterota bacterium]|jgi:FMN phosphatase YigB (HAD superfamily)
MKYIFDFDDVLFQTTKHRKEHMFVLLQKAGIPLFEIEKYYKKARLEGLSLKSMLAHFLSDKEIQEKLYEEIMEENKNFINTELLEKIKKIGKENCFLITHGGTEFQNDKIERIGATPLFSEIIILQGSKKTAVENICERFREEKVIFIDDKVQYFEDLDFKKYPNLQTILYDEQGLEKLISILPPQ